MSNLIPFQFESNEIRTVVEDGEAWVVAKDVAQALEYAESSNPARLISAVPDEWKGVKPIHTPGGSQEIWCLSEQGLSLARKQVVSNCMKGRGYSVLN